MERVDHHPAARDRRGGEWLPGSFDAVRAVWWLVMGFGRWLYGSVAAREVWWLAMGFGRWLYDSVAGHGVR
ncbi:hypothetical protein [Paenibacillus glucanolyticus]|uniref:hypothetical protein n=1 Tax=Paenibacillus glucanolyticus TaxID=59843 RepID=UPI0034CD2401